ncbi:hypothetical protein SC206_19100 [Rouxiella sp. T17]|uniref:DUF6950 family protein n=1 Tax=Rouxiella sp. T17 TaxID=3085684 RepID=UPI002FC65217
MKFKNGKHGKITAYVSQLMEQDFEYGVNDCHLLAIGVLDIIADTNHLATYKGKYSTAKEGLKYAKTTDYPMLEDLCKAYGDTVDVPSEGDIIINSSNSTIFWLGKIVVLNELNKKYQLEKYDPTDGMKYYRIRE